MAKIGVAGDRVYLFLGRVGYIHVYDGAMKQVDVVWPKDSDFEYMAKALGIESGPRDARVKKTPYGAVIDGLQGQTLKIRELLEIGGLTRDDLAEIEKVRLKKKFLENLWTVEFKTDRPDYVITVLT